MFLRCRSYGALAWVRWVSTNRPSLTGLGTTGTSRLTKWQWPARQGARPAASSWSAPVLWRFGGRDGGGTRSKAAEDCRTPGRCRAHHAPPPTKQSLVRRLKGRLGKAEGIVVGAHKLARIIWAMIVSGQPYDEAKAFHLTAASAAAHGRGRTASRHAAPPEERRKSKRQGRGGTDGHSKVCRAGSTPDGKDAPRGYPTLPIPPHRRAPVLSILW